MAQAYCALGHGLIVIEGETVDLAHGFSEVKLPGRVNNSNSGAIVAPVFQPLQSLKD